MTSCLGLQLTPGQRCLLDLLQRKLLNTIKLYANLSLEKQNSSVMGKEESVNDGVEAEMQRLKDKIRRISARQKRFTLEIINGNGNNTIPKESFFQALGLVTKEALSKLNSKTNERRRRTTANPRFSHEAIQAKRALEPLQKRLEPRVTKEKRETNSRKPHKNQQQQNNNIETSNNINKTNISSNNSNNNNTANESCIEKESSQQQALHSNNNSNNPRSSSRSSLGGNSKNRSLIGHNDRGELLAQFGNLQKQIVTKVNQIKSKRESNKRLEKQNELIRKRGLDLISTINMINPNLTFQEGTQLSTNTTQHSQNDETVQSQTEPLDIWIDMKCDESLDGLD